MTGIGTGGRRYRVVQWATGNIGSRSLRAVIEHPDLDLVGVWVSSDAKVGRDAGELCGLGPVGVSATGDAEEIISLGADCILYMADRPNHEIVCRLLASGANIVTTRGEYHRPESLDPAVRERIEEACRYGDTSLHSTGSSPGFITESLPIVLTSLERRLDLLTIDEFADMSTRNSPELIFGLMGFGRPLAEYNADARARHGAASFGPSLAAFADAVGLPLDEVVGSGEAAAAARTVEVAAGTLEAGTVGAQRMVVSGIHAGQPVLRFRSNWYLTSDIDPAWELGDTGWRVQVAGDLPLDVRISFPVSPDEWGAVSPGVTAHRPVNCVPYVCAAPPGILTGADVPQVVADLSRSAS